MRVYIAGPMRGYPRYNFDAFAVAAAELRALGHEVLSPAENDLTIGFDPDGPLEALDLHAAFRWDVEAVLAAEVVVLLPGWERSEGATLEFDLARAIGTSVVPLDALLALGEAIKAEPEPEPEPEPERSSVPDLMAALEASLAAVKADRA